MSMVNHLPKFIVVLVLLASGGVIASKITSRSASSATLVDVQVPLLSSKAKVGQESFEAICAQCHGKNASGSEQGPPLIHDIYNPGHHSDQTFQLAAVRGVKRHHWNFGDMPPQPQVSAKKMASIIIYVRELQQANGIVYREHRM
ncbi:cytochrome c [Magnetovibrio sp.]|uniref:c-type cytochrome n=1 Tax=Magnetovibrio sp. TaxID=2024836 RepID=UPI002F95DA08